MKKEINKVRKAAKITKKADNYIEAKVGSNIYFWADIANNNKDKVEELGDVILYLMRKNNPAMSYESEKWVREYQFNFMNAIIESKQHLDNQEKEKSTPKKDYKHLI